MFGLSMWHILIIGLVLLVLFGGRISNAMGEVGRSIGKNAQWELSQRLGVCYMAAVCRPG